MAKITMQIIPYGGVYGGTVTSIVREILTAQRRGHDVTLVMCDGDSLLPRRRSISLSDWFERGDSDVCVTVDHDITWKAGDVIGIAERALELDAIVGGLYSKRCLNQGWASRVPTDTGTFRIPSDRVIETPYVGSGFMAIPRRAMRQIVADPKKALLTRCWDGKVDYWDFYHTLSVPHASRPEVNEYLSEDWAFCYRARLCGVPVYTDLRTQIVHYGERGFTAIDGIPKASLPQQEQANESSG